MMEYVFHKGYKIIRSKTFSGMWQIDPLHGASLSRPYFSIQECKNVIDNIFLKLNKSK